MVTTADLNPGRLEQHSASAAAFSEHSGLGNLNLAEVRGLAPSQDSLKGFPDGQYLLANITDEKAAVLQATGAEQSGGTVVEYPSGGSVEASGGCGKTKIKEGDDGSYDVTVEPPKDGKKNGSCTIKVTPPGAAAGGGMGKADY
jgi:hypothetical protein